MLKEIWYSFIKVYSFFPKRQYTNVKLLSSIKLQKEPFHISEVEQTTVIDFTSLILLYNLPVSTRPY